MLIHSRYRNKPPVDDFNFELEKVPITVALVKSLGVGFDEHMMFDSYVADKCKSSFYHLRNLSRIRKYLTRETAAIVVHAFVTSKLDNCNSLLFGLPKYQMKRLQYVQNTAARIVCRIGRYEHITPVLVHLHWLPVHYRIVFKIVLLVYKTINGMSPRYLTDLLQFRESSRSLRSVSNELLRQPRTITKTYGDKAFSVCAPRLWNILPLDIRKSSSVYAFKKSVKTYLFSKFVSSKSLFM